MSKVTMDDIVGSSYKLVETPERPKQETSALLLIDVQYLATPEHLQERAADAGLDRGAVAHALNDYAGRFRAAVSSCRRLLSTARECSIPAVHVKIQALSTSGRDTGAAHRRLGWIFPPGAKAAASLPDVEPLPGEIVVTKTASGAFSGTSLDTVFRNMGIQYLFVCGFMTDECVQNTANAALDLGYIATIVGDAATTYHAHAHDHVVAKFASWGLARSSSEVETLFRKLAAA